MKISHAVLIAAVLTVSAPAHAQPVDAGSDGLALVDAAPAEVGSGSGSAAPAVTVNDAGSAASTDGAVDTLPELKAAYGELKQKYEAVKGSKPDERIFAIAGLLALVLKLMLDGVNYLAKYRWKQALAWVALGLAVPIALLSRFVVSLSWVDAIIVAGSGPGAVVVHELLKKLQAKKPAAT